MGRAEFGTPKHVSNQMKAKGLQKLRFYCQLCEKQCRDDNGFKCHIQSPSHVRKVRDLTSSGKGSAKIGEFSRQFQSDFIRLLRMSHGEKKVGVNRFYQEYISNKQHIHMNATKWPSLTVFASFLGRNGICRVTEDEQNGLMMSYIDNSPETVKRKHDSERLDMVGKNDEDSNLRHIEKRIKVSEPLEEAPVRSLSESDKLDTVSISLKAKQAEPIKQIKSFGLQKKTPLGVNAFKKLKK